MRPTAKENRRFIRLQRQDGNSRVLHVVLPDGKEDGLTARQDLRPEMPNLSLLGLRCRQLLRLTSQSPRAP